MLSQTANRLKTVLLISVIALLAGTGSLANAQQLLWSSIYGGRNNEGGSACRRLADGYIVVGSTYSYGSGDYDVYLLKLDDFGDTLWARTFGGTGTDYGYDVIPTADSGFLVVGSTTSFGAGNRDAYIIKTDRNGNFIWSRTYGGTLADEARSVANHPDSGFVICGMTESFGPGYADVYLLRLNKDGNEIWTRAYGGAGGDNAYSIKRTPSNDYIVVGSTGSFGEGYSSVYALKINQLGDTLWTTTYGGAKADFGRSVAVTQDGGFIFAGRTHSYGAGYGDVYIVKTDSDGNFQWENYYGGKWEDNGYSVYPSMDGGYLIAGTTESFGAGGIDIYLVKADPLGNAVWTRTYGGDQADYAGYVVQNENYDYFVTGHSWSGSAGGSDLFLLEISGDSPTDVEEWAYDDLIPDAIELGGNYPNPFNATTTIQLALDQPATVRIEIYNVLGQTVKTYGTRSLPVGTHYIEWDGRSDAGLTVASGVYFFRVETARYAQTQKMMLLK
jgi:hypothetical protein